MKDTYGTVFCDDAEKVAIEEIVEAVHYPHVVHFGLQLSLPHGIYRLIRRNLAHRNFLQHFPVNNMKLILLLLLAVFLL